LNPSPFISVIIPTLQEEKALPGTLEQFTEALRRKYNLEIIVSDGGSTDRTIDIARSKADRIIEHHEASKQNISIGRNNGARIAFGGLLIFFNADVVIEDSEKFFSTVAKVFEDERIIAATCNVNIYPGEESILDWMFHNFFNGYFWLLNIAGMGMGRGECQIVRKKFFFKVGEYDNRLAAGEDYDLFMRLHKLGRTKFIRTLTVFESPRRFRKYGYLWITLLWFLNAAAVLICGRSLVDHWKPVR